MRSREPLQVGQARRVAAMRSGSVLRLPEPTGAKAVVHPDAVPQKRMPAASGDPVSFASSAPPPIPARCTERSVSISFSASLADAASASTLTLSQNHKINNETELSIANRTVLTVSAPLAVNRNHRRGRGFLS
jgi:hypothetical protein